LSHDWNVRVSTVGPLRSHCTSSHDWYEVVPDVLYLSMRSVFILGPDLNPIVGIHLNFQFFFEGNVIHSMIPF
jgi:hypothetical protein